MIELFNKSYVMPDATTRPALIERLGDKIRATSPNGAWKASDDFSNEGYWELPIIFVANLTAWMAESRPQGITISKSGSDWTVEDVQTGKRFSSSTLPLAITLAAHTLFDLVKEP